MFEPQRLHPLSYLTGLIKTIKQNFIAFIIFIINIKNFDYKDFYSYIWVGILFLIFVISFIFNAATVYTTRYWIEGHHFVVTKGLFNETRKELDIKRIQSFDTTQDIVNRIFGGVIMQVSTPSDSIKLEIVTKQQSDQIEQNIKQLQTQISSETDDKQFEINEHVEKAETHNTKRVLFKLSQKELWLMALTSGSIGIALVTLGPILGSLQEIIPWKRIFNEFQVIAQTAYVAISILIICVLFLIYLIGMIIEYVRYFGYTLVEEDNQLNIRYGLLKVKTITVPTTRIQGVIEKQSFLRRIFGFTAIHFVITSEGELSSEASDTAHGDVVILPFIKKQKAYQMLEQLVPSMYFKQVTPGLPKGGIRRNAQIGVLLLVIAGGVGNYFWSFWSMFFAGLLSILFIINSVILVRYSGYRTYKNEITVKKSQLHRTQYYYVKQDKLIGYEKRQNPFMQRAHLADFDFMIAKGDEHLEFGLRFIQNKEADLLEDWYVKEEDNGAQSNVTTW